MKIETLKLRKPYPVIVVKKDGKDWVFSLFSFYVRIKK